VENTFAAHIREDGVVQTIQSHLMGTAKLASDFASVFGCKDLGYLCGLVHDIGKYSQEFQKRIRGHSIYVDHSTA
jgi:CRISPR-associated endonuclease/helicase Cas3